LRFDRYNDDREVLAKGLAEKRGLSLIPPYDHPSVIAGQGTAAKELLEDVGELDVLLVCLGGGGLLAGSALAAKALSPRCKVIGVEPEAGNDGQQSLQRGEIVRIPQPRSIADGAITTHLGVHTFPIIRSLVDDIVTVTEAELIRTMAFFAERMKVFVEPTGCLAAAAAFEGKIALKGLRAGVIVSGGNVNLATFAHLIQTFIEQE
jgi:threonine dehydratase